MMRQTIFKIVAVLLLILFAFHGIFFAISALVKSVTIASGGQIAASVPQTYWTIGQYANGTYYSTNGQTRINSADPTALINNAMSSGGYVYVEPGSYQLTGRLIPRSNVYLNVSSGATLYQPQLTSLGNSFSLMFTSGNVQNFTLDGGHWNGNKGSLQDHRGTSTWNSNFNDYFGIGFYGGGGDRITIKNVYLENVVGQGIDLAYCTNSLISNCTVINAGDNPITLEGDNENYNSIIEYSTVIGGQDVGINTWHANNCTLRYNTVANVTQYSGASHWGIAIEQSSYVNIIGNTVSRCAQNIESDYSDHILISGNILIGGNPAMEVKNTDTAEVTGNDFTQVTGTKFRQSSSTNVNVHDNIGYP
jgi:hypothetical protein